MDPAYHRKGHAGALPDVWLRAEVVARLVRAASALGEEGLALLVWDGWRPLALQQLLWDEYRAQLAASTGLDGEALDARARDFVAPVSDEGPVAHSTGAAVDVTLCTVEGEALDMGGEFDELTDRSRPSFYERSGLAPVEATFRQRRRQLCHALNDQGFERLPSEWWHFEYGTPNWAKWTGGDSLFGAIEGLADD